MQLRAHDKIQIFPFLKDIRSYRLSSFRSDLLAALTVALLAVPQSIAYALAADLPPSVGIFAAIFGSIFGAAFGSSRHLVMGPTNTMAILIETGVSEILFTYYRNVPADEKESAALAVLMQLTLLVGITQIIIASFKLGKLTQFVSRSVLVGYVAGAALALTSDQVFYLFGIVEPSGMQSLLEKVYHFSLSFDELHVPTTIVGVAALSFLFLAENWSKKIPSGLVVIIASGIGVWFFQGRDLQEPISDGMWQRIALVKDIGAIQAVFPTFTHPFFEFRALNGLVSVSFAIALLGILETTTIARNLAVQSGQQLSSNQEIFGLSAANISSSFFGGMPSAGSFARSSLNYSSGAKTRFAALLSGVFCLLFVLLFRTLMNGIPLAALAAILIASAPRMVRWQELKMCFLATRSDACVLAMTLVSCILFRIDTAFYVGAILSVMFYLKNAATPAVHEYQLTKEGLMCMIASHDARQDARIRIIHVEGEIFFGAADFLQETLSSIAKDAEVKVIILHLKNARQIDATACLVMQQLHAYLRATNRYLVACGLTRQGWHVFCHSGLTNQIGKENLFLNDDHRPHYSSRMAYAHALSLL